MLDELGDRKPAFFGLFVATFVAMLGLSILSPILPTYARTLGASGLVLGVIFSGFAVSRGVMAPFVGQFSDRYGRRDLLLGGLVFYGLLAVAYAQVSSTLSLGVVRFLQGFASVLVTPIAQSYVGDITPEGLEGSVTNTFYISLFGGIAVGPSLGGYLAQHYGLQTPFYVMAALTFVAVVLVYLLVPELDPEERETATFPGLREAGRAIWADYELRGIMSYIAARGFYRWGFNSFFPVFAVATVGLSESSVGVLLSVYMAVGGVLQAPLGRLTDSHAQYRTHFILAGGVLAAAMMLGVPFAHGFVPLVGLIMGMGAFSALSRTAAVAIRTERGRVHGMGLVTGAFTMSLSVGQVVGPVGFGVLTDYFTTGDAFIVGGIVGLLGTVAAVYYLHRGDHRSDGSVEDPTAT